MTARALASAKIRGWGWNDDLTNGKWLNAYCPGLNGPSDIDSEPWCHVLHNAHLVPHREATIEYKPGYREGEPRPVLPKGQEMLLKDRPGLWRRANDGTAIERRVWIVRYFRGVHGDQFSSNAFELMHDGRYLPVPHVHTPDHLARLICGWVWPS